MLQDAYEIIGYVAIPFMSIFAVLIPKKKRVWLLPFISFALFVGWTALAHPEFILDNLGYTKPDDDFIFISGWWILLMIPRQIFASLIATAIAFAITKREKPEDDTNDTENDI